MTKAAYIVRALVESSQSQRCVGPPDGSRLLSVRDHGEKVALVEVNVLSEDPFEAVEEALSELQERGIIAGRLTELLSIHRS